MRHRPHSQDLYGAWLALPYIHGWLSWRLCKSPGQILGLVGHPSAPVPQRRCPATVRRNYPHAPAVPGLSAAIATTPEKLTTRHAANNRPLRGASRPWRPLSARQLGDALIFADAATVLLDSQDNAAGVPSASTDPLGRPPGLAAHRAEIDQATGMLTEQAGVGITQ